MGVGRGAGDPGGGSVDPGGSSDSCLVGNSLRQGFATIRTDNAT